MDKDKTLNWAMLGVMLVTLGAVLYTNSTCMSQINTVQGDVSEVKAMVDGLARMCREHTATSGTSAPKTASAPATKR
ncbi:MAG: hypothetical protein HY711_07720 [Candidatus Melainabacteria bacterium]|nr:hypothetical protein [Candidatus Melainabacteria bacterium]